MRIQLVGATVAVLAGSFVVWWGKDHIEATVAGLALLYALQFTDSVKYLVRQHALLEMQMNSVCVGLCFLCRGGAPCVSWFGGAVRRFGWVMGFVFGVAGMATLTTVAASLSFSTSADAPRFV